MADNTLFVDGTAIVWANTTDYSSTVSGLVRTHQIDLTDLASGSARQGAKADLGASRARQFLVLVGLEFATPPVSDEAVEVWWAGSPSATAANANPGGTTGSDAAYTGTAGDSLDDSLKQLLSTGALTVTADATTVVQYAPIGVLTDIPRYGMPVVDNNTSDALHSDAVEMYIALLPLIDQSAAA